MRLLVLVALFGAAVIGSCHSGSHSASPVADKACDSRGDLYAYPQTLAALNSAAKVIAIGQLLNTRNDPPRSIRHSGDKFKIDRILKGDGLTVGETVSICVLPDSPLIASSSSADALAMFAGYDSARKVWVPVSGGATIVLRDGDGSFDLAAFTHDPVHKKLSEANVSSLFRSSSQISK